MSTSAVRADASLAEPPNSCRTIDQVDPPMTIQPIPGSSKCKKWNEDPELIRPRRKLWPLSVNS